MKRKKYTKPVIVHTEHLEAVAAACPEPGKTAPPCNPIQS